MTVDGVVSVCVPTFNGAEFLGAALASALAQGPHMGELLVCDDASTDETPALIRSISDPRVRYERFETNAGQPGNFNRCLSRARGAFWTLLSADDRLDPAFLAVGVAALRDHPDCGYFVAATATIDAAGFVTGEKRPWPAARRLPRSETSEALLGGAAFNLLGLLVRREALVAVGAFRTDLTWGHDWEWILRLSVACDGVYSSRVLAEYRVHDGSGTEAVLRNGSNGPQELEILREAIARLSAGRRLRVGPPALRRFGARYLFFAEHALLRLRRRPALANLRDAVRADRGILTRVTFWKLLLGCAAPGAYARMHAAGAREHGI